MRSRFRRFRSAEKGATIAIVAISMVALLGMTAITVDYAMASATKEQVQGAVDAAALAIAKDCAVGESTCAAGAGATATWYANKAGASVSTGSPVVNTTTNRVTVRMSASGGSGLADAVLGSSVTASTASTAAWTEATIAKVKSLDLPLAFEYCNWKNRKGGGDNWYVFDAIPYTSTSAPVTTCEDPMAKGSGVYNQDGPHTTASILSPGLLGLSGSCDIPSGDSLSVWFTLMKTFVSSFFDMPAACVSRFGALKAGDTVLVPIYSSYKWKLGGVWLPADPMVKFVGFAPFKLAASKPFKSKSTIISSTAETATCTLRGSFFFDLIKYGCLQIKGSFVNVTAPYTRAEYASMVDGIAIPVDSAKGQFTQLVD